MSKFDKMPCLSKTGKMPCFNEHTDIEDNKTVNVSIQENKFERPYLVYSPSRPQDTEHFVDIDDAKLELKTRRSRQVASWLYKVKM